jgi:hypothetical protein
MSATLLIRVKDAVTVASFRGTKLLLIAKINVASDRKEKLLP